MRSYGCNGGLTLSIAQTQGRNIRHYANYLIERVRAYRDTKTDWVRAPESRLEKLTVEKGLLRETEVVQHQITALLKCDVRDYFQTLSFLEDECEADPSNSCSTRNRRPRLRLPCSDYWSLISCLCSKS